MLKMLAEEATTPAVRGILEVAAEATASGVGRCFPTPSPAFPNPVEIADLRSVAI